MRIHCDRRHPHLFWVGSGVIGALVILNKNDRHKSPACGEAFSVPGVGIEPTLLAEREFESRASTNSATRASR